MVDLIDEVHRLRGRLTTALMTVREPSGLSALENTVLSATMNSVQPPTVPQIGRSLGHPRQVIQRAADSLAERGLISCVENPDHKRARRLVATPAGKTLHAEAERRAAIWAEDFAEALDLDRLETAVATLRDVRVRLQQPETR